MDKYGVVFPGNRFAGPYPSIEKIHKLVCFPELVPLIHPEHWRLLEPRSAHEVTRPVCEAQPEISSTGRIARYVGG